MKRIESACLAQTVHFKLRDDIGSEAAKRGAAEEVSLYKEQLIKGRGKYQLVDEAVQPDGSVVIKLLKQYSSYPTGSYLD